MRVLVAAGEEEDIRPFFASRQRMRLRAKNSSFSHTPVPKTEAFGTASAKRGPVRFLPGRLLLPGRGKRNG